MISQPKKKRLRKIIKQEKAELNEIMQVGSLVSPFFNVKL